MGHYFLDTQYLSMLFRMLQIDPRPSLAYKSIRGK